MKKREFKKMQLNKKTISSFDADKIGGGIAISITCVSCHFIGTGDPTDPNNVCLDEPKKADGKN
ncbi:MAG: hypothetical protein AAF611_02800 [Bacteroidota bacterium]